mgnify:CR=1 FL=1
MKVGAQDRPGKGERLGHLKVATPADTGAGAGEHEKQQQEQPQLPLPSSVLDSSLTKLASQEPSSK